MPGTNDDVFVVRFTASGAVDTSFGNAGKVATPIGDGYDLADALVVQPNGSILAVGSAGFGSFLDFAVVRYLGSAVCVP
jgi:hypothetical protein